MSGMAASEGARKTKSLVWLSVGLGLLLLIGANAHLVYVAVSSQPDCVAHVRHGQGSDKGNGTTRFSAATSSCSSKPTTKAQVE